MTFWDSSAVVPLLIAERSSHTLLSRLTHDPAMVVWWGTTVECASAIARLQRDGALDDEAAQEAFGRLKSLAAAWHEVDATEPVRETAIRLLRVHPLRTADALQLAAAVIAAERRPATLPLISLDDRLASAARKEGFELVRVEDE